MQKNTWPDQIEARLWDIREKKHNFKFIENNQKKTGSSQQNRQNYRRGNNEMYEGKQTKKVHKEARLYNKALHNRDNEHYGGYYEYKNSNYDSWANDEEWREHEYEDRSYGNISRMNIEEDRDWYDMVIEEDRRTNRGHY